MRLLFDLSDRTFRNTANPTQLLREIVLKRGDGFRLEVEIQRNGVAETLVGTPEEMVFVVKKAPGGAVLAKADVWTLEGGLWKADINMGLAALVTELGEATAETFYGEFTYTLPAGLPVSSRHIKARVENDFWKGNESTPALFPDPENYYTTDQAENAVRDNLIALFRPPTVNNRDARLPYVTEILYTRATAPDISGIVGVGTGPHAFQKWDGSAHSETTGTNSFTTTWIAASPYTDRRPKYVAIIPPTAQGHDSLTISGQEVTHARVGEGVGYLNLSNNLLTRFQGVSSLTTAILNANPLLEEVDMAGMSSNSSVTAIDVSYTNMSAEALNRMFNSLGIGLNGPAIMIAGTPGTFTCDPSIATAKGWVVYTI